MKQYTVTKSWGKMCEESNLYTEQPPFKTWSGWCICVQVREKLSGLTFTLG
jgi:hypothetical protein